jgi:histidinol-phosphate aminotransferase
MNTVLTAEHKRDLTKRGFSRRSFGRIAAMITTGVALPFYNEPALAQFSKIDAPPDAVMINANENPLGPCAEARAAIHGMVDRGGRYLYGETDKFRDMLAEMEGLKATYVNPYPGSSAPLHQAVLAFTGPERPFVTADPGYEAGERAAEFIGAKAVRVPLTKSYGHDVRAMAAVENAGLFYVCNPNNPTGTVTPRSDIEWLIEHKPKDAVVMIDEAYIHLCTEPMCSRLVASDKDVVILRTFSKIYGMAGIRAGAAFGRPDLLSKIGMHTAGALPITAMAAATASLQVKNLVSERRKIIGDIRNDVFSWMDKHKFQYVPSVSNKFMVDVRRPGMQAVMAMRNEKVFVGRVWPSWPTHVRVTVGTQDEMEKFKAAFLKVMA